MSEEQMSFEQAYAELEGTVRALQEGGQTLEEMIALFERGNKLARICSRELDAAELRLSQLQEVGPGQYTTAPLESAVREPQGEPAPPEEEDLL